MKTTTLTTFAILATLLSVSAAGAVQSAVDCSGLTLEHAACVPGGPNHKYLFGGYCALKVGDLGDSDAFIGTTKFPVELRVEWKSGEKTLTEKFRTLGGFEWNGNVIGGTLETVYVCSDDPVIASAACNVNDHTNDTGLTELSAFAKKSVAMSAGRTTLAAAAKLSGPGVCTQNPPPPPPATKQPAKPVPTLDANAADESPIVSTVPPIAAVPFEPPRRQPVGGSLRVPDPTLNPQPEIPSAKVAGAVIPSQPAPTARSGIQVVPTVPTSTTSRPVAGPENRAGICSAPLGVQPAAILDLGGGRSLEGIAVRGTGATTRVRLTEANGATRELDARDLCVDQASNVYALDGGSAHLLGRLPAVQGLR